METPYTYYLRWKRHTPRSITCNSASEPEAMPYQSQYRFVAIMLSHARLQTVEFNSSAGASNVETIRDLLQALPLS